MPRLSRWQKLRRWVTATPRESGESFAPSLYGPVEDPREGVEGICCSGGGIRSSAFNLGALQRLSQSGHLARADYLAAVSGGSYIAAAFSMIAPKGGPKAGEPMPFELGSPEEQFLRNRTGYMAPSGMDLLVLVWRFLVGALATFALVAVPVAIFFFLFTWAFYEPVEHLDDSAEFAIPGWCIWTVAGIGALSVVLGVLSMATQLQDLCSRWAARLLPVCGAVALLLLGMPALRDLLGGWSKTGTIGISGTTIAFLGGAAGLIRELLVPKAETADSKSRFSIGPDTAKRLRLGLAKFAGAVLGPVLILAAGYGAISLALAHDVTWGWAGGLAGLTAFYLLVCRQTDLTGLSMHRVYRRRLASAFALERVPPDGTTVRPHEMRANPYRLSDTAFCGKGWPTLLVCAAANISDVGATPRGREVTSFTFSANTIGSPLIGAFHTPSFERALDGHRRMQDATLMAAVAMSGAALAPSMGKLTNKSLRFLMALTNVRLGVWVPSPKPGNAIVESERNAELAAKRKRWEAPTIRRGKPTGRRRRAPIKGFGRPRPLYLVYELLGLNHVDSDYLYVTDGGHYENLGLVELLRRGCTTIWCFDASGGADAEELGDAIALARAELGVEIDIDPTPLFSDRPPKRACVQGSFTYPEKEGEYEEVEGTLFYCKNVLPAGIPWDVRSLAGRDPVFPNDSTADQLFTEQRFEGYRVLGWNAADAALNLCGPEARA